MSYAVEYSTNLTQWTPVAGADHVQIADNGATLTWQARQPLTTANVFFRLKVTQQ